ncbi:hypothetical protein [Streptomyces sp. PKU-EA00015]|uniref:hypothetical protein n=1 Tax=Streptomyces sp. PKU-EA00015 TaxID=2748326 RepID=UPI00210C2A12|nr:hypothetical protein [Streptomyces sp. PKU-EA00015]
MQETYLKKYGIETSIPMWAAFRRRKGLDRRNLRDDELLPWKVKDEHRHMYPAIMLRVEARRRADRDVSDRDLKRLTSWKQSLNEDQLVVHYDPDTEAGFFYVPREAQDDDLIRKPSLKTGNQARD